MRIPAATYRLRLGPDLTLDDAAALVPYLDALNDVGGDPGRFGTCLAEFRGANVTRRRSPHALSATSTHDTKRTTDGPSTGRSASACSTSS
jgi:maltooligosyltrehalose synthase